MKVEFKDKAIKPGLDACSWGLIPYAQAREQMQDLCLKRQKNLIDDRLIYLEHPPVITEGRRDAHQDLLVSEDFLRKKGIDFIKTDRGGLLTYHGPGQLVVYFIVDLKPRRLSIGSFVRLVEEGACKLLQTLGVQAQRKKDHPGLWVGDSKIVSVGLHVSHGVTSHGIAININPAMEHFSYLIPCGLAQTPMTSVALLTKKNYDTNILAQNLHAIYEKIFSPTRDF